MNRSNPFLISSTLPKCSKLQDCISDNKAGDASVLVGWERTGAFGHSKEDVVAVAASVCPAVVGVAEIVCTAAV